MPVVKNSSVAETNRAVVRVEGLPVHFPVGRGGFWGQKRLVNQAVDDVSFAISPGETLGLVGESGSGKSTTGRAILRRMEPTEGRVFFQGQDITEVNREPLRQLRRHMQMVFQDPYASLNPRMKVIDIVSEPLIVHGLAANAKAAREKVADLLQLVGLPPDAASRYPHNFRGGQRQRVGIARALALKPEFIVADEVVSGLDVSIRAQVVNLLQDLQEKLGLTYLFIAHDLSIVRHISRRVAIMYAGKIVEIAGRDEIYSAPKHPYTEALLSAVPIPDLVLERSRERINCTGPAPDPLDPPKGCRFQSRCPLVTGQCREAEPPLEEKSAKHWAACWHR